MGNRTGNILKTAGVLVLFLVLLSLLTGLVMPKYMDDLVEGSMISQYYGEAGGHEVLFLGDCEVYANIDPLVIYEDSGISSYVRGSSQQLMWQSYYILEETLRYEVPKAVVFNVNAMKFSEPVKEEYNRLTIDYMKWSPSKAGIIRASMTEEEKFLYYAVPITRYHSRIFELKSEDLRYLFGRKQTTVNGHQVNTGVVPMGTLPAKKKLADYSFGDICWQYLDGIRKLCADNGVQLILMKAPSQYPYWYDEYDAQIAQYAQENGLRYYNFLNDVEQIGLDYSTDTYDGGLHLNESGARKLSLHVSDILRNEVGGFTDFRDDPAVSETYARLKETYAAMVASSEGAQ